LQLGILGPLEVRIDDSDPLTLGGRRQKALLAVIALHANEVVSTDRLIDELWGERAPPTALHTVQVFVSRLRKALGPFGHRLLTRPPGYVLDLGIDEIDAGRYERLHGGGRAALASGDAARAAALLHEAEALWRGPALAEFAYEPFAQAPIARLEELRLSGREELIEAELALGQHTKVVSELEALVREQPFRERPRGQLMLALYRCGRQADALEAFQDARRTLVEELAVEPGQALRDLEQAILRQDPGLRAPDTAVVADLADAAPPTAALPEPRPGPHLAMVRKTATVLVVRVATTGGADPERMRAVITATREQVERTVAYHGGVFVPGLGGEIVGVFGIPLTKEDDALRALRTACELRTGIGSAPDAEFVLRMGVDTGELVGETASDVFGEPLGAAVAFSLTALPGEILLSEETRRQAAENVRVEPALDGAAWRLVDLVRDAPPLHGRRGAPIVGRERELAVACETFERAVRERSAHLLTVLGDAGIGKSRFALELIDRLGSEATVLAGRCLSYGDGVAFWPLREALTQAAGGESRAAIRGLLEGSDDADVVADVIATSLGLASVEGVQEQVPWAFRRLLELLATRRPVILVIEDTHWADELLLELIEYLTDWLRAPSLILCLARGELLDVRPALGGGRSHVHSLVLPPLAEADTRRLLNFHLGERRISASDCSGILQSAEGNPLFLEQIVRATAEDPRWNREREIPATIQSLLAARLDRLGPGERAYIERAALIGREFWPAAVAELLPDEARPSAAAHLDALVRRGLIQPDRSSLAGEELLRFHHILIRDVAYRSTPKSARTELHERFADWLEQRGEQYDEFTGYHLEQAFHLRGDIGPDDGVTLAVAVRAGEHLAAAGRRAAARGDANSSVSLLERSTQLFDAGASVRPDVCLDFGTSLRESGELRKAERVLKLALGQADSVNDEVVAARTQIELSALRGWVDPNARVQESREIAERAMQVFERAGDESGLSRAWLELAEIHWTRCRVGEMEQALERGLAHAERAAVPMMRARLLRTLAHAAVMGPRPVGDAIHRCNAILERVSDDILSATFTRTRLAVLEAMRGHFDRARTLWRESQQRLHDIGLNVTASLDEVYRAFIELMCETPEDVVPELAQACVALEKIGERGGLSTVAALQARLLYVQGRYDECEQYLGISARTAALDDVAS
jgi:DNA-binding SARP family transcriptional activator